jgi:hypothetical protein
LSQFCITVGIWAFVPTDEELVFWFELRHYVCH